MLTTPDEKTAFLRCLDKYDRLGAEGVKDLLTSGRRDESGDFMPGLGMSEAMAEGVLHFLKTTGATNEETLFRIARWFAIMTMPAAELDKLATALELAGAN